jgi:hypothetical protein
MAKQQKALFETLKRIEARLSLMEDMLDDLIERADANGQQAATWQTPKSWTEAQERSPSQERS